jgi:hypothetical protein
MPIKCLEFNILYSSCRFGDKLDVIADLAGGGFLPDPLYQQSQSQSLDL